jgi:hypothetical protein
MRLAEDGLMPSLSAAAAKDPVRKIVLSNWTDRKFMTGSLCKFHGASNRWIVKQGRTTSGNAIFSIFCWRPFGHEEQL